MKRGKHLSVRVISLPFVKGAFLEETHQIYNLSERFKFANFFLSFSMCFKKFFDSGLEVIGPLVHFNSFPFGASELSISVVPPPQRDHTRE